MKLTIEILVYVAAAVAFLSSWLMLRMKDEFQMMHFMSPPASVSVILITAAIFLQNGRKPESFKAIFVTLVLLMMNSVITHATARAFRLRETRKDWGANEGEEVPIKESDEIIGQGNERTINEAA